MNGLFRYCSLSLVATGLLCAQGFTSGSSGADGALNYLTPGTYNFDPDALHLNPAGDNIFHFTTINIVNGVILTMKASYLRNKPVIWLASGDVTIAGRLVLDGTDAAPLSGPDWITARAPAEP